MGQNSERKVWPGTLLLGDDESVREILRDTLELCKSFVSTAANTSEASHLIDTEAFDGPLSNLHMPGPGDGFTVIRAMRHIGQNAITMLSTRYLALKEAMDAILLQVDEILVKPIHLPELVDLIGARLDKREMKRPTRTEPLAVILERDALPTIGHCLCAVSGDDELTSLQLSDNERTGHLPQLIRELVHRLRVPRNLGTRPASEGAAKLDKTNYSQGYSIPMIIEELRILQISILNTLQSNLYPRDFSLLRLDEMTIADEVDSQSKQTIVSFAASAPRIAALA
jgi:DNA-binding response OmpR family regulator